MNAMKQKIINDLDKLSEEALTEVSNLVETLKTSSEASFCSGSNEPNGAAMARIMKKMAARNALSEIKDPSAWQREIREDLPLPGREA